MNAGIFHRKLSVSSLSFKAYRSFLKPNSVFEIEIPFHEIHKQRLRACLHECGAINIQNLATEQEVLTAFNKEYYKNTMTFFYKLFFRALQPIKPIKNAEELFQLIKVNGSTAQRVANKMSLEARYHNYFVLYAGFYEITAPVQKQLL